ncbi:MAG: ABC transporter ATP-binding protein [Planctomycetota bacterium]
MLKLQDVTKTYDQRGRSVVAVHDLNVDIDEGEFVVVHGPSGSGKSTLLLLLGGMLPPDSGRVLFQDDDVYGWAPAARNRYRKRTVGFIFQRYFLIPYLSMLDNIRMPLVIQGRKAEGLDEVRRLARRLQIEDRLAHRPGELSVGEQQRAAVARAMIGGKRLILADEPTGNLDTPNAQIIARCLREEREHGRTILLVTHDPSLLDIGTRHLRLQSGELLGTDPAEEPTGGEASATERRT